VRRQPLVLPAILAIVGVLCVEWGAWWWVLMFVGLVLAVYGLGLLVMSLLAGVAGPFFSSRRRSSIASAISSASA